MPSVFVEVGSEVALHRPSLSAPAPNTRKRLLGYCERWAADMGWALAASAADADGAVVGPGVDAAGQVVRVLPGQGIDGFRWGIRHLALRAQWPVAEVAYGGTADHVADVRHADSDARGVVVLLHGGFWMDAWRRDLMDGIGVDLARRGWESWSVEYRRVGSGGGWPCTLDDVAAAIRAATADSGCSSVTVVGHSAGGHLALAVAQRMPAAVARVVSLAGLCDLDAARRQGVGGDAVDRFLGGSLVADASPVAHVPLPAEVVVAHCAGDSVVPIDQSRRYAAAAGAAGGDVELLALEQGDHMSLIEPENGWGEFGPRLFPARRRHPRPPPTWTLRPDRPVE